MGHLQLYIGHYVNVQYEIPFQPAEEKLPAILADVFFIVYMRIYHACILSTCMLNKGRYHRVSFIVSHWVWTIIRIWTACELSLK